MIMSGGLSLRWIWIALAAAFVCIPAHAQGWYSSLDIDDYGDIAGASVTELPLGYYDFGYEAYVQGLLNDPNGNEIMDVTAFDNGEGYAEADTFGTGLIGGSYGQYGDHEMWYYDWPYQILAATQTFYYWAGFCLPPDGEVSDYEGVREPVGDKYGAQFGATLYGGTGNFIYTTVSENVTLGGGDGCAFDGQQYGPWDFGGTNTNFTWSVTATNRYGQDTIAIGPQFDISFYEGAIAQSLPTYTTCTLVTDTQVMSHSCTGQPYQTNMNSFVITAYGLTVTRGGGNYGAASGPGQ
jgi:hypothetical protein